MAEVNVTGIIRRGTTGAPFIESYTRDTFLGMLESDLENVFFGSNGQDFTEHQNTVKYTHTVARITTNYPVIFDNPHTSQNVQASAEFNGLKPQIRLQETKLLQPINRADTVVIRGVKYTVENYMGDGVGVITLYLRRM